MFEFIRKMFQEYNNGPTKIFKVHYKFILSFGEACYKIMIRENMFKL
jgi:hypothetical protein